jgi:hypothetical protein
MIVENPETIAKSEINADTVNACLWWSGFDMDFAGV